MLTKIILRNWWASKPQNTSLIREVPGRIQRSIRFSCSATSIKPAQSSLHLVTATPVGTQLIAHFLASSLHPGDTYLLHGDVGSGKSTFSRAFIRAALREENLPVPSPTFLLQNIYDSPQGTPIHHFDLYRLKDRNDLERLDLPTSFSKAVSLIEWPEVLGSSIPHNHVDVRIAIMTDIEQQQSRQRLASGPNGFHLKDILIEDSDDDDEYGGDIRWRRIDFTVTGNRWQEKLARLQHHIKGVGGQFGCFEHSS